MFILTRSDVALTIPGENSTVCGHESNSIHLQFLLTVNESYYAGIDSTLQKHTEEQAVQWQEILKYSAIAHLVFFTKCNLPLYNSSSSMR